MPGLLQRLRFRSRHYGDEGAPPEPEPEPEPEPVSVEVVPPAVGSLGVAVPPEVASPVVELAGAGAVGVDDAVAVG
jgi:hypothetical protein